MSKYSLISDRQVHMLIDGVVLNGVLSLPRNAVGLVVCAHGSAGSRILRSRSIVPVLQKAGIGTLFVDLLSEDEYLVYENRFATELLTERLIKIIVWLWSNSELEGLPVGLFGAGTGAAAVLSTAATLHDEIACVVCYGGRADLTRRDLHRIKAPTLLIAGGSEDSGSEWSKKVLGEFCCEKKLEIIPGATGLFEEEGVLECVASFATNWFRDHFRQIATPEPLMAVQ